MFAHNFTENDLFFRAKEKQFKKNTNKMESILTNDAKKQKNLQL